MRVNEDKISRIKEIQLEMLIDLDKFCRDNNIQYCLAYGTLLGAIRHNGYIPWDEDIDIWMTRENYEKFTLLYKSDKNLVCSMGMTENYPLIMAKLINQYTILQEEGCKHVKFKYGVYIDIFILDTLPSNKLVRECKLAINYLLYAKFRFKYLNQSNRLIKVLQNSIDQKRIEKKQKELWSNAKGDLYKDDSTLYFFNKNKTNKKYIFPKEFFIEFIEKDFEGHNFFIPKKYDELLTLIYGDYMTLPPEDKRQVHQFITFEEIK